MEDEAKNAERQRKAEQWLKDNAEAIARYNEEIAKRGVFSDGLRRF